MWALQEVENMSQKKTASHTSNCKATIINEVITSSVPLRKSKEEAKKTLYINRI
jgi:hypothetical protein